MSSDADRPVNGEADSVTSDADHLSRDADRQQMPEPMRRDVRLLGDLLGEVLRESGGQDLLDDVERLRRAVIAARRAAPVMALGRMARRTVARPRIRLVMRSRRW